MDIRSIAPGSVETQRNRLSDAIEELLPSRTDAAESQAKSESDRVAISSDARALASTEVADADLSFARMAFNQSGTRARAERVRAIQHQLEAGTYLTEGVLDSVVTALEAEFATR